MLKRYTLKADKYIATDLKCKPSHTLEAEIPPPPLPWCAANGYQYEVTIKNKRIIV